jgi:GntR family transcriptional regulator
MQEFADTFREAINTGVYSPGDRLPRATDVAAEHSVSRGLIQDAYARLRDEGLVETIKGRGTFVRTQTREQIARTNLVQRAVDGYVFGDPGAEWDVIDDFGVRTLNAPAGIDKLLGLEPHAEVVARECLFGRRADRAAGRPKYEPIQLSTTFFPSWVVHAVPAVARPGTSRGAALARVEESIGGPINWIDRIGAEPASPVDAQHLQTAAGSPVIRIFTVGALPDGRPVEATVRTLSGERFQLGPLPLVRDASAAWVPSTS